MDEGDFQNMQWLRVNVLGLFLGAELKAIGFDFLDM